MPDFTTGSFGSSGGGSAPTMFQGAAPGNYLNGLRGGYAEMQASGLPGSAIPAASMPAIQNSWVTPAMANPMQATTSTNQSWGGLAGDVIGNGVPSGTNNQNFLMSVLQSPQFATLMQNNPFLSLLSPLINMGVNGIGGAGGSVLHSGLGRTPGMTGGVTGSISGTGNPAFGTPGFLGAAANPANLNQPFSPPQPTSMLPWSSMMRSPVQPTGYQATAAHA